MEHRHWRILQQERESLYERFLSAEGEEKTSLLIRIMEIDDEMEALKYELGLRASLE